MATRLPLIIDRKYGRIRTLLIDADRRRSRPACGVIV